MSLDLTRRRWAPVLPPTQDRPGRGRGGDCHSRRKGPRSGQDLNAWLKLRGGEPGPLFTRIGPTGLLKSDSMSNRSVARLVQRYADHSGLDPGSVTGHSLRAGFLTEAARTRALLPKMQEVSRQNQ